METKLRGPGGLLGPGGDLPAQASRAYTVLFQESNALYEAWSKEHGLTYNELLVVLSLTGEEPPAPRDICRQWTLPKQTVHSILEHFRAQGWVVLEPEPRDQRSKRAVLTPAGRARLGAVEEALLDRERRVWEAMGPQRTRDLVELTALYGQLFRDAEVGP